MEAPMQSTINSAPFSQYAPPAAAQTDSYAARLAEWAGAFPERERAALKITAWLKLNDAEKILDLSHLDLSSLPPLPETLRKLKADHNRLEALPENLPPRLQALDVHVNHLLALPESLPFSQLQILNLANNKLATLAPGMRMLHPECRVYIRGNPIAGELINSVFGPEQNERGLRMLLAGAGSGTPAAPVEPLPPALQVAALDESISKPLLAAMHRGDMEAARMLWRAGVADPNQQRAGDGYTMLCIAILAGQLGIADMVLADPRTDPNKGVTRKVLTPLYLAAEIGAADAVRRLLAHPGIDPNKEPQTPECAPPLCVAVQKGHEEVVAALLAHEGIDPNKATAAGTTPLLIAVREGHLKLVHMLLAHPRLNPNKGKMDETPLSAAAFAKRVDLCSALLSDPRTDPNVARRSDETTALFIAASRNDSAMLRLLLAHARIDPNKSSAGATPLCVTAQEGHVDCARILLDHPDIDPDKPFSNGVAPLGIAREQQHDDVVKCLLAHPRVDPNGTDTEGHTLLFLAAQNGDSDRVRQLLVHPGIDPNKPRRSDQATPLFAACANGHREIVRALLEHPRIDPNRERTLKGVTPLLFAVHAKNLGNVQLLLSHERTDPDKADHDGKTPLAIAATMQLADIAVALLERGARLESVAKPEFQRKLILALGETYFETLAAGGTVSSPSPAAQALLARMEKMPTAARGFRLAAMTIYSVIRADVELSACPLLQSILALSNVGDGTRAHHILSMATAQLRKWDGCGIDGAGAGHFSILQTERSRLPSLTRAILECWRL